RKKENSRSLDVGGPLRYAVYGFFFTGPLSHFFYFFMEHWIPPEVPLAGLRRLLLDRLVLAPAFLMLFFLIMNFLEGKDASAFAAKMRGGFWPALRMNWRVWTPLQFININYVPLKPGSPGPLPHWEDGVQHPLQHGRIPPDATGGGLAEPAGATCFPPPEVPGALRQPGSSVLVCLPGLLGEVTTAGRTSGALWTWVWGSHPPSESRTNPVRMSLTLNQVIQDAQK
ncbi:PXMP2 isoform 4, partial [Pan troglodytes]